ncbi:hypothetical protein AYO44_06955 [Planctomycetaceae bacterium SCGC AG-212-F19]|nr:hypothetical protein AYO44_06955 [Planctomycetaceae bacterium SCGC AG-212-F19]
MSYLTFTEYVAHRDEGLWLPMKPAVASTGKINVFPVSQSHLNRIRAKSVKAPQQGKPIPSPTGQYMKAISRVFE